MVDWEAEPELRRKLPSLRVANLIIKAFGWVDKLVAHFLSATYIFPRVLLPTAQQTGKLKFFDDSKFFASPFEFVTLTIYSIAYRVRKRRLLAKFDEKIIPREEIIPFLFRRYLYIYGMQKMKSERRRSLGVRWTPKEAWCPISCSYRIISDTSWYFQVRGHVARPSRGKPRTVVLLWP